MNWLAHLYLSQPDAQFRIGNLLPDLCSRSQLADLPEAYQKGIRCHRKIDIFTDAHPRFQSCVKRFPPPYRRYGGILTDVYFDHLLSRDWSTYSPVPLPRFISDFYAEIYACLAEIPVEARPALSRMREENWLGSYHTISGTTDILTRISRRFRRPFDLTGSLPFFQHETSSFSDDFHAFFPEMIAHLR
jgi:acyl carrier protein phosphodiesterase